MANRKSEIPIEKVTLNLGKGDVQRMAELFPSMGSSRAIRTLVRNFIRRIEATATPLSVDLNPSDIKDILNERATGSTADTGPETYTETL